jgi:site-specific DNA-methyltransferase (adenine-specific)
VTLSLSLFCDLGELPEAEQELNPALSQWFTPEWAAAALVDKYLGDLSPADLVVEPSCGLGSFIKAIPEDVPVIGVEIDPDLAERARANTGRTILTGDFGTVPLPDGITAVVGNPPFVVPIIEQFLARAHRILPVNGRCGLLLPAYAFQTYGRVNRWNDKWSLQADMIPRGLFANLRLPLAFCTFHKDTRRQMVGLALYAEAGAVSNLAAHAKKILQHGRPRTSVWRSLVEDTLQRLGGRATLEQIYRSIEPRRPTATAFWREKVRQQLQTYFIHCGLGEYALAACSA